MGQEASVILPLAWAGIILFALIMYVILDGFDLGLGILFPFMPAKTCRDKMMNSVAPVWDGNETWLIMGGAGLLAAFPIAYSIILSAFYLPIMLMLIALIFRGVAFEFRFKADKYQYLWDASFCTGSFVAAFMQGVMVGAFIKGIGVIDGKVSYDHFEWVSAFSFFTGFSVVFGYALLGSTWLIMKTEGTLQATSRKIAKYLLFIVAITMLVVSLWTPMLSEQIYLRWFSFPNIFYLLPVPLHTTILFFIVYFAIIKKREYLPFIGSIGLFLISYTGLGVSLYPYIVPRAITIWEASSQPESQLFALTGVLFLMPVILGYTIHSYWVFRGKVSDEGYH